MTKNRSVLVFVVRLVRWLPNSNQGTGVATSSGDATGLASGEAAGVAAGVAATSS